nr:hypothetical protein CFP56_64185 [Quercus suber]
MTMTVPFDLRLCCFANESNLFSFHGVPPKHGRRWPMLGLLSLPQQRHGRGLRLPAAYIRSVSIAFRPEVSHPPKMPVAGNSLVVCLDGQCTLCLLLLRAIDSQTRPSAGAG